MEHQIFRVVVQTTRKGVRLSLQDHPNICAEERSRKAATEAILDRISEAFGDGEPVLDFLEDKSAPSMTQYWVFRSNEKVTTINEADLFSGGICNRCGVGLGGRKISVKRQIREAIKGDAAFSYNGPVATLLFSEAMIEALLKAGLSNSDFAPVVDKLGRVYGEVLSSSARAEWVPVKKQVGVKIGAQSCPQCSFSIFGFVHVREKEIRRFIAKSSESVLVHGGAIVGTNEPEPVLSTSTREAIRKQKELRGFVWGRVGLVDPSEIDLQLKYDAFPKPCRPT